MFTANKYAQDEEKNLHERSQNILTLRGSHKHKKVMINNRVYS